MLKFKDVEGNEVRVGFSHLRGRTVCYAFYLEKECFGIAKLHPNDNYCKAVGRKVSLTKLLKEFLYRTNTYPQTFNCKDEKEFRTMVWNLYWNKIRSK